MNCFFQNMFLNLLLSLNVPAFATEGYVSIQYSRAHSLGYKQTPATQSFIRSAPKKSFVKELTAVPGKYSLQNLAGPVEDQGSCGSCWAFSLTSVLRGTWMTQSQDPGRLSFNYLLNCATDMWGCDGGDFAAAQWLIDPKGAPSYGTDGDYTETDGQCVQATPVASAAKYYMLGSNSKIPSFKDIAYVVGVLHRPVSVDVAVDWKWESYSKGTYAGCSAKNSRDLNHMVLIEGYDCESAVDANGNCTFDATGNLPPKVGTWLIRNSWGTNWGEDGYMRTKATDSKGRLCNLVANDALYFELPTN